MAQNVAKGGLAVVVDEAGLECSVDFKPESAGAEWTAEKLLRSLMDNRVAGVPQRRAEELIQKFSRAKAPVREILVQGQAPELPVPELPEWEELSVPAELAPFMEGVLASASPPELFRLRVEKVRVERVVKKPAALPFLPAKEELVVDFDKKEVREALSLDTQVLRTGYAKRGQRLCILGPQRPGKVGKSIFGRPIPAPQGGDLAFVTGRGVVRQKTELVAELEGFVRIGDRWVDVVPFAAHEWSVDRSSDGASYLLSYQPGHPSLPAPTAAMVLAKASGASADELLPEAEVDAALRAAMESGEPLFSFSLSKTRDSVLSIVVSPDRLEARLRLVKARGRGRPLDLSKLGAELKKQPFKGLNMEKLKQDVIAFQKGRDNAMEDYLLVAGKAPTRGKDRQIAWALAFPPPEKVEELKTKALASPMLTKLVHNLDVFPVAAASKAVAVQQGQKIGELTAPQVGQPGVDVYGEALPGIPGNDPPLRLFENVGLKQGILTAEVAGFLFVGEAEGHILLRVVPGKDARIDVSLSEDSMEAYATLVAESGAGQPLGLERVIEAVKAAGAVNGLDFDAIGRAVSEAREGKPVLRKRVAKGRQPIAPGSQTVSWIVRLANGRPLVPGPDGKIDLAGQERVARLSAGDSILAVSSATGPGAEGMDVRGRPVQPGAVRPPELPPPHDSTIREAPQPDGGLRYIAATGGELVRSGNALSIKDAYSVEGDIGLKTGNISFPGSVKVQGSVLTGFSLMAQGEIRIQGSVEAALVSSDGSVRIAEGVKGQKRGTVRARGGIEALFAEQALLLAVEDIRIRNAVLMCNVKTNGRLVLLSDKGSLVGGLARVRRGIDVECLGSEKGMKTEVSFGQDYLVADMIEAEEREIEKVKALAMAVESRLRELERTGSSLEGARQEKVKILKLLEKRSMRVFNLREKFEEHAESSIKVRGTVYPGVILESHNRFYEVRAKRNKVSFFFDPAIGRIVER